MTTKTTQLKIKGADYDYLKAVQQALGLNATQTLSFILKHSKPYVNKKIHQLTNDSTNN